MVFLFVDNSSAPAPGSSSRNNRGVRAHAAKEAHAVVRRRRMAAYHLQQQQQQRLQLQQTDNGSQEAPAVVAYSRNGYAPSPEKAWYGDCLSTLGLSLPHEQGQLMRHYIHQMIPLEQPAYHSEYSPTILEDFSEVVVRTWLPAAMADPAMFLGICMCAARDLYARTGVERWDVRRMQYKAACLPLVRGQVLGLAQGGGRGGGGDKMVLFSILQLASDDFMMGDLAAFDNHVNAICGIVAASGGMQNLNDMGGLLRRAVEVMTLEGFGKRRKEMQFSQLEGVENIRKKEEEMCITVRGMLDGGS